MMGDRDVTYVKECCAQKSSIAGVVMVLVIGEMRRLDACISLT